MSESSHWVLTKILAGHAISVNIDTVLTMWLAMGILLIGAILIVKNLSIIPTRLQYVGESIINYFASITAGSMGEKESKKHNVNYVLGLILIDYYRFEDFAEAKKHILNLPPKELAILINKDSRLLDIASNLGIMTPNYNSNDNDSYSNDGYTYTM